MFQNFFEFGVSRPFPYGRLWNLFTLIFATVVLAFLFVYATATAGYESVTVSSNNYHLRQTGWHTAFSRQRDICNKRLITVGDKVYTTDGVVPWSVMNWRDRTTGKFIWALDYEAQKIEKCYLVELVMEPSIQPEISTNFLTMNCTMGDYEVKLGVDLALPININVAAAQFAALGFNEEKRLSVVWNAFFDLTLAWDGLLGLRAAAPGSAQNYQTSFSVASNGTDFCGHDITSDDLSYCRRTFAKGEVNTYTRWSSLTSNTSDRYAQDMPSQLVVPFTNFAIWITQLAWWDLGLASSTNLLRNYADRAKYLQRCPTCAMADALLARQPYGIFYNGIVLSADDPGFTPPKDQELNVQYLCQWKQLKSPGDLVQAILVAALGLFATFWSIYIMAWTMYGSHFGSAAQKRSFRGETDSPPGSAMASATLPYQPLKTSTPPLSTSSPVTGYFDPPQQQMGYVSQQQGYASQQGYAPPHQYVDPLAQHGYVDPHAQQPGWKV